MNKLNLYIKNADNGYILSTELVAEDGGSTGEPSKSFVFHSPEEITAWFNATFPVQEKKLGIVLYAPTPNRMIAAIRVVRMHTGMGLREAKDFVDTARNNGRKLFEGMFTQEIANMILRDFASAECKAEIITQA